MFDGYFSLEAITGQSPVNGCVRTPESNEAVTTPRGLSTESNRPGAINVDKWLCM